MSLKSLISKNKDKIYDFLNKSVPILQGETNNLFLHDINRFKIYNKTSEKTFVGKLNCGACCILLNYYLNNLNIKTEIMVKTFGYGKYLEDHCFLMYDNMIIDPTYRQMFLSYKYNDNYSKYLFEKNSFIFVGSKKNLKNHFNNLYDIHFETYKQELSDENLDFWERPEIFKPKINMHKIAKCENYAKDKNNNYLNLHKFLKNFEIK